MPNRIKYVLITVIATIIIITGLSFWRKSLPLISPTAIINAITRQLPTTTSTKIIYGFFPYWNFKYVDQLNINLLTHFAYFAIDLNPDGSINKTNAKNEQEPGWNKLNSLTFSKLIQQIRILGQKTVICVTAMDPDIITSLTNNPATSKAAIDSIIDVYKNNNFDYINVDFEYVGEPPKEVRDGFTNFIADLKTACQKTNPNCQIDIDVFADSAEKYRLWNLPELEPHTSHFIIMAYDYYRKTSTQAGPVAPLTGKCSSLQPSTPCLEQDILTHLAQFTKIIPSSKIILGIPFYGYEWQTASQDYLSNTYKGTGRMASYSRINSIFQNPKISSLSAQWSSTSLSPYLTFQENGQNHQIHFENPQSLSQKIKLVYSANLGGIAIWALGYEVPHYDIWQPISELTHL